MKVLIVTPTYLPDITGNAVTAQRLYKGLRSKRVSVDVIVGADANTPIPFKPDIIHALHALKGGVPAMEMAERLKVPFVITITGTDLNIDLLQTEAPDIFRALERAARIITFSGLSRDRLSSRLPSISGKIRVIRPSVDIGRPEGIKRLPPGFNFLLPSGIRKVKATDFAIKPLEILREEFSYINLTIAGPVLDETEWKKLSDAIKGKEWITCMTVPHDEMPDIYNSADIILNTSISEGLPNAILEAMHLGKAVLASDCDGNNSVVSNGRDGVIYNQGDEEDFIQKARSLVTDAGLRERLGIAAREKVAREYSLDAEFEGYLMLYREVLEGRPWSS